MPKGISTKEYIEGIELPTTKQDKYMYQLLMIAKEILKSIKKEDIVEITKKEPLVDSTETKIVPKPKKSRAK